MLDPVDTKLVEDTSSSYQASLLYMASLLRQKAPTDEKLYIGYNAAMDQVSMACETRARGLTEALIPRLQMNTNA